MKTAPAVSICGIHTRWLNLTAPMESPSSFAARGSGAAGGGTAAVLERMRAKAQESRRKLAEDLDAIKDANVRVIICSSIELPASQPPKMLAHLPTRPSYPGQTNQCHY